MTKELTDMQELFCTEYTSDWNGTKAAIRAGYSELSARQSSTDNMRNPSIRKRIDDIINKRLDAVEIDAQYVLRELYACWNADIADIIDPETGALLPVHDWSPQWRKMASGIKIKETRLDYGMGDLGEEPERTGAVIDVIIAKKDRFLELLGKHVNVKAFQENVKIDVTLTDTSHRLSEARKRMKASIPNEN